MNPPDTSHYNSRGTSVTTLEEMLLKVAANRSNYSVRDDIER